jgi:hypothetical protein
MNTVPSVDFNPDLFANREIERELVENLLSGKIDQRLLEFTGIAGQGKTELLKWTYTQAKSAKNILSAYIDFGAAEYHRPEIHPILETISAHLVSPQEFDSFNKVLFTYTEEFRKYQRQLWEESRTADRTLVNDLEKELIKQFKNGLNQLLASHKILLCLDSTERAYSPAIKLLEEEILQDYTDNPNFILVIAGQHRFNWSQRSLRRQIKTHPLGRLDQDATRDLISRLAKNKDMTIEDREYLLEQMWKLTLGHPFSSYKFLDILSDNFNKPLTKDILKAHYARSIDDLIQKVVKDRILEHLELSPVYPPPEEVLMFLAPLRRIEFGTVWFMLNTFLGDWFQDKPFIFFEELLAEFQNHSYVFTPWVLGAGFDLEDVTRNIMLSHLRLNQHDLFMEIQEKLAKQYDIWVSQTRDASQVKNVVESLYHHAMIATEKQADVSLVVQNKLEAYLGDYFTAEFIDSELQLHEQFDRLKRSLERDKELSQMTDPSVLLKSIESRMKREQS